MAAHRDSLCRLKPQRQYPGAPLCPSTTTVVNPPLGLRRFPKTHDLSARQRAKARRRDPWRSTAAQHRPGSVTPPGSPGLSQQRFERLAAHTRSVGCAACLRPAPFRESAREASPLAGSIRSRLRSFGLVGVATGVALATATPQRSGHAGADGCTRTAGPCSRRHRRGCCLIGAGSMVLVSQQTSGDTFDGLSRGSRRLELPAPGLAVVVIVGLPTGSADPPAALMAGLGGSGRGGLPARPDSAAGSTSEASPTPHRMLGG